MGHLSNSHFVQLAAGKPLEWLRNNWKRKISFKKYHVKQKEQCLKGDVESRKGSLV